MSSSKLRTVFFGTPHFALPSLEACLAHSELIAVVSQPDKPRGRGHELSPSPVKARAQSAKIPVHTPASLKRHSAELADLRAFLAREKPELFVVTAYGNLFPEEFLSQLSRLGAVNVHASLLPRWRGAAPIQRSLEAGDTETGVALQKMVLALDAGDVVAEARMAVSDEIQAPELTAALAKLGGEVVATFLTGFSGSQISGRAQDEKAVTLAAKIDKSEGLWDPAWTARETHNRVRAFRAWPGVRACTAHFGDFKLLQTAVSPQKGLSAGELRLENGEVLMGCGIRPSEQQESLRILEVQPANKAAMSAFAYFQNLLKNPRPLPGHSVPKVLKPNL